MKRSGFLKLLGALLVAPELIESKANTYDGKVEYMSYSDFAKKYPLTPEQAFEFQIPTKESYDGIKTNIYLADEVGQRDPKSMVDLWRRTGILLYKK